MTKPINLYIQSRIKDELSFNRVELHTSKRQDCGKTKEHEISKCKQDANFVVRKVCAEVEENQSNK